MTDREKLIEIISSTEYGNGSLIGNNFQQGFIGKIADHLLANGVTVHIKIEKPPTDLTGKCGGCVFAKPTTFGRSTCYVECTNEDHLSRRKYKYHMEKRQRTCKACKSYVPLPEPPKED